MDFINDSLVPLLVYVNDKNLYIFIQALVVLFLVFSIYKHYSFNRTNKRPGFNTTVKRGKESMQAIWGTFGFFFTVVSTIISFLYDMDNPFIVWLINVLITAYLFLLNPWIRNKVIEISSKLKDE